MNLQTLRARAAIFAASTFLLPGCVGLSIQEVRETKPIYFVQSEKLMSEVLQCFIGNDRLDELRGDGRMHVLAYPEKAGAELSIGAPQASKFRHFYHVSLVARSPGTQIEVRRSPANYLPIQLEELIAIAKQCV